MGRRASIFAGIYTQKQRLNYDVSIFPVPALPAQSIASLCRHLGLTRAVFGLRIAPLQMSWTRQRNIIWPTMGTFIISAQTHYKLPRASNHFYLPRKKGRCEQHPFGNNLAIALECVAATKDDAAIWQSNETCWAFFRCTFLDDAGFRQVRRFDTDIEVISDIIVDRSI